jgi:hypothetical protein
MWLEVIVLDNAGLNEKFDLYVSEWTQRFSDQVLLLYCMLSFKMQLYSTPCVSLIFTRLQRIHADDTGTPRMLVT